MDLIKILKFATKKHMGQFDKGGELYIFHPIRVALKMETDEEKVVALLHDVLEDTDTTIEELKELGLSDKLIKSIITLTRQKDIVYMDYIKAISIDEIAKKVKLSDLEDNMDPDRQCEETSSLQERYKKAYKYLKMEV